MFCLPSETSSCVTTSAFASLIDIPNGIVSSKVRLNICEITEAIKKYKSITKKKKKRRDKEALLEKIKKKKKYHKKYFSE